MTTLYSSDVVSVGGSSTYIVLEFPHESSTDFLLMGSCVSLSYSVFREKTPVFALGKNVIQGFSVGNKYVAGSMVLNMFLDDEIATFISGVLKGEKQSSGSGRAPSGVNVYNMQDDTERYNTQPSSMTQGIASSNGGPVSGFKNSHTYMRDDITSFNIHVIFSSEQIGDYESGEAESTRIVIYDAQFLNNGQVMSIDDIVTESTASFVAKEVKEQHRFAPGKTTVGNINPHNYAKTGSALVNRARNRKLSAALKRTD